MHGYLLESLSRRERSAGGTALSFALHLAVIVPVVYATSRAAHFDTRPREVTVTFRPERNVSSPAERRPFSRAESSAPLPGRIVLDLDQIDVGSIPDVV